MTSHVGLKDAACNSENRNRYGTFRETTRRNVIDGFSCALQGFLSSTMELAWWNSVSNGKGREAYEAMEKGNPLGEHSPERCNSPRNHISESESRVLLRVATNRLSISFAERQPSGNPGFEDKRWLTTLYGVLQCPLVVIMSRYRPVATRVFRALKPRNRVQRRHNLG